MLIRGKHNNNNLVKHKGHQVALLFKVTVAVVCQVQIANLLALVLQQELRHMIRLLLLKLSHLVVAVHKIHLQLQQPIHPAGHNLLIPLELAKLIHSETVVSLNRIFLSQSLEILHLKILKH